MKKIICAVSALILIVFSLTACGGGREYIIPEYPADIRMDIGACITPPKEFVTQESYNDIAAAGINIIEGTGGSIGFRGYTVDDALTALGYAYNAGLKVLVDDYRINLNNRGDGSVTWWRADFNTNFPHYSTHPAVIGNIICDEPNAEEFDILKTIYDAYKTHAPEKIGFINLYPNYANPMGGIDGSVLGGTFEEYVENFMKTVGTCTLSYDHYPLIKNIYTGGVDLRGTYFTDMETVRHIAKKYSVPVHNYIQTTEHYIYPLMAERDLRWQIAVNQAFGISSFSHFTYWLPSLNGYYSAPVGLDGTKTVLYDRIKAVNSEVLAWSHVYLRYEWQGTAAIINDPYGPLIFLEHADFSDGIEGIKSVTSTADALCGIFTDADGNKGFMLTNAVNPYNQKTASITVRFDNAYKGVMIFEKGVPNIVGLDKNNGVKVELESGEGRFLIPLKPK